jgi:hypothetical protein
LRIRKSFGEDRDYFNIPKRRSAEKEALCKRVREMRGRGLKQQERLPSKSA